MAYYTPGIAPVKTAEERLLAAIVRQEPENTSAGPCSGRCNADRNKDGKNRKKIFQKLANSFKMTHIITFTADRQKQWIGTK